MSAYEDLKKKSRTTHLDCAVIYYGDDPYDESEIRDAEDAAKELAQLRLIKQRMQDIYGWCSALIEQDPYQSIRASDIRIKLGNILEPK